MDELDTDRPHFGDSPLTIGASRVQLEAGFFSTSNHDAPQSRSFPTLLRIGTGEDTELRLESDTLVGLGSRWGLADLSLGGLSTAAKTGVSGSWAGSSCPPGAPPSAGPACNPISSS